MPDCASQNVRVHAHLGVIVKDLKEGQQQLRHALRVPAQPLRSVYMRRQNLGGASAWGGGTEGGTELLTRLRGLKARRP